MKLNKNLVMPIIKAALREDIGRGDITGDFVIKKDSRVKANILIKETGIITGLDVAKWTFQSVDSKIRFKSLVKDGDDAKKGTAVAKLEGFAKSILTAERTALNFLSNLSGIATQTKKFLKKINNYKVKIMDTRKTTPLLRYLEKYAVRVGGGVNHRMGLWDQVLIKENHLRVAVKNKETIHDIIERVKKKVPKEIKIELEVENLTQFKKALEARPDIIMLDNWRIKDIKRAVRLRDAFRYQLSTNPPFRKINYGPLLEVSGRVGLENIKDIARTGVDRISIGSLTHSIKSLDISLEVIK